MVPAPRPYEFNELEMLNPQLLFLPKIDAQELPMNRDKIGAQELPSKDNNTLGYNEYTKDPPTNKNKEPGQN